MTTNYIDVPIYDHDLKVGSVKLPPGKVSTHYIKSNWSTIISGMLSILPVEWVMEHYQYTRSDAIKWLKDPNNWKREHKGIIDMLEAQDYWGVSTGKGSIHRMYLTNDFQDGMDLNFISTPKDAALMSIHLHSD